jgi:hypothetical protein
LLNDGDGSTGYDVDFPIQIAGFDPAFHDASLTVQPLPFALMKDRYPMLNGRGYPDTVAPGSLVPRWRTRVSGDGCVLQQTPNPNRSDGDAWHVRRQRRLHDLDLVARATH